MTLYVTFDAPDLFFRPGMRVDSIAEARAICDANGWEIYSISSKPKKWTTDGTGFKPHFNVGLGMNIETRRQYSEELKKRNLIEVGNEPVHNQTFGSRNNYFDDDTIRAMNEMGAGLSDGEAKGLIENG